MNDLPKQLAAADAIGAARIAWRERAAALELKATGARRTDAALHFLAGARIGYLIARGEIAAPGSATPFDHTLFHMQFAGSRLLDEEPTR